MNRAKKTTIAIAAGVIFLSLVLDRITKIIIITKLMLGQSWPEGNHFISLYYTRNTGVAFSMFDDVGGRWLLVGVQSVLVIIIAIMMCVFLKRQNSRLMTVAFSMMLGGGLGNLLDRIIYGSVIDFVSVGSFPVFNGADSCLTIGCIILIIWLIFFQHNDDKAK